MPRWGFCESAEDEGVGPEYLARSRRGEASDNFAAWISGVYAGVSGCLVCLGGSGHLALEGQQKGPIREYRLDPKSRETDHA
jgi:hypothetical protein